MSDLIHRLSSFLNLATITLEADRLAVHSAPGRYVVWLIAFVVVAPVAFVLWRKNIANRITCSVFFASLLIPVIVVPGIACESIDASPSELSVRTGFWFAPTLHEYELTGIEGIREEEVEVRQRAMDRTDVRWVMTWPGGRARTLSLNDLFRENRAAIREHLEKHGVKFVEAGK
jgi:hypothetical protein